MGGPGSSSTTIESRVLLPNGHAVNQLQFSQNKRQGGHRMIEDRLVKPARTSTPQNNGQMFVS